MRISSSGNKVFQILMLINVSMYMCVCVCVCVGKPNETKQIKTGSV